MNVEPSDTFEDPNLKRALRDFAGDHKASELLRARVTERLAAERAGVAMPSRRLVIRRFAAAAALVIGLIAAGYGVHAYRERAAGQAQIARLESAKQTLLDAMLAAHQRAATDEQPLSAPLTDPIALAAEASQRLGRTVPQPTFGDADWTLDAAALCSIDGKPSSRFRFVHAVDGRAVTLVSMPESVWDGLPGSMAYTVVNAGHPIVGYAAGGSLNCIVADASVPTHEAETLRDRVRSR